VTRAASFEARHLEKPIRRQRRDEEEGDVGNLLHEGLDPSEDDIKLPSSWPSWLISTALLALILVISKDGIGAIQQGNLTSFSSEMIWGAIVASIIVFASIELIEVILTKVHRHDSEINYGDRKIPCPSFKYVFQLSPLRILALLATGVILQNPFGYMGNAYRSQRDQGLKQVDGWMALTKLSFILGLAGILSWLVTIDSGGLYAPLGVTISLMVLMYFSVPLKSLDGHRLWKWKPAISIGTLVISTVLYFGVLNRTIDYSTLSTIGFISLATFIGLISYIFTSKFHNMINIEFSLHMASDEWIAENVKKDDDVWERDNDVEIPKEGQTLEITKERIMKEEIRTSHEEIKQLLSSQNEIIERQTERIAKLDDMVLDIKMDKEIESLSNEIGADDLVREMKYQEGDEEIPSKYYSDNQLRSAGWSDEQITILKGKSIEQLDTPLEPIPSKSKLNRMKKAELVDLAETHGLDSSGTKAAIIERLLG
jgi:DNA-binding ferritin-like protein